MVEKEVIVGKEVTKVLRDLVKEGITREKGKEDRREVVGHVGEIIMMLIVPRKEGLMR